MSKSKMAGLYERQDDNVSQRPETVTFQGHTAYILNDLITFDRPFFVGCIREPRKTIQKKNIPDDQYWFATYSKQTNIWALAIPENKKAKILISEDWVRNNLPKFTGNQNDYKYKPLPPLLELSEDEKFRDEVGNIYEVEVRGEKTRQDIRFSWVDVSKLFEMESNNLRHRLDQSEYDLFCFDGQVTSTWPSKQNRAAYQVSTYLTYKGLLKIIFASHSCVADRFQDWASSIIYTAHLGTTEQRVDVAADIIGINAQMVKDVLTTCITSMPCVYLFNVGKVTELKKYYADLKLYSKGFLFKWGRTNDLKRRTGEHIKTYGNLLSSTLQLKYFSPVDNLYEAEAENEIRQYFQERAVKFGNHKELVILDKTQIAGARRFYEDVYIRFSSEVDRLLGKNNELEKDTVYLRKIVKCKDESIEALNRECEGLREQMFAYQRRELEFKEKEVEFKEKEVEFKEKEVEYKTEIERRRQRSGEHKKELTQMMERLSISHKEHKRCQDVLCEIALLTPAQREELASLFAETRKKMDPFLTE